MFVQVGKIIVQAEGDNTLGNWLTGEADDLEALEILSCAGPSPLMVGPGQVLGDDRVELPSWVPTYHWSIDIASQVDAVYLTVEGIL